MPIQECRGSGACSIGRLVKSWSTSVRYLQKSLPPFFPHALPNGALLIITDSRWLASDPLERAPSVGNSLGDRLRLLDGRNDEGYRQMRIGTVNDAMNEGVLNYQAAVKLGRDLVEHARKAARAAAEGPVPTIASAVDAYLSVRDAVESAWTGKPVASIARNRLKRHVVGKEARGKREAVMPAPLAAVALHALQEG